MVPQINGLSATEKRIASSPEFSLAMAAEAFTIILSPIRVRSSFRSGTLSFLSGFFDDLKIYFLFVKMVFCSVFDTDGRRGKCWSSLWSGKSWDNTRFSISCSASVDKGASSLASDVRFPEDYDELLAQVKFFSSFKLFLAYNSIRWLHFLHRIYLFSTVCRIIENNLVRYWFFRFRIFNS